MVSYGRDIDPEVDTPFGVDSWDAILPFRGVEQATENAGIQAIRGISQEGMLSAGAR